jgi:hypothetical protein
MVLPSVHGTIDWLWKVGLKNQNLVAMDTAKPYNPLIAGVFLRSGQIKV